MAREHKFDRILMKSISRFARNTTIVLEVVRELKDLGVEIIFEKENISSFDGDGELMLTVLSSFAHIEMDYQHLNALSILHGAQRCAMD